MASSPTPIGAVGLLVICSFLSHAAEPEAAHQAEKELFAPRYHEAASSTRKA